MQGLASLFRGVGVGCEVVEAGCGWLRYGVAWEYNTLLYPILG